MRVSRDAEPFLLDLRDPMGRPYAAADILNTSIVSY